MATNRIHAFNTHYEIYDYRIGENRELEKSMTYRDFQAYTSYPKYMYDSVNSTLYIPRGFDPFILEQWNGKPVTMEENNSHVERIFYNMKKPPRNEDQQKAIRFLTGQGEFSSMKLSPQKVLIMPPGTGKTYCAIAAIQQMAMRAMIIMHTQTLKDQWVERISECTSMGGPNIVELKSSDQLHGYVKKKPSPNQKVFITTRSLLISYCDRYGINALSAVLERMGIGIKVFDEAHKEYTRTLFIDYVTNVKYTFYLTATFQLSNYGDNQVFQRAFNIVPKLKIKSNKSAEHIIYLAVLFNSRPNTMEEIRVAKTKRGLNRHSYIAYEMEKGILAKEVEYIMDYFINRKKMKGKSLILSPKKSSCDYFKEVGDVAVHGLQSSCSFYTGNKVDNYKHYDIISATAQMLGTGEDIPDLRFMHNTEPIASLPNTDQFSGRLRPFYYMGEMKDTYYIEYIDIGFEKAYEWYKNREKLLKKKVKEVKVLNHVGLFN